MIHRQHLNMTIYVMDGDLPAFREAVAAHPKLGIVVERRTPSSIQTPYARIELLADDVMEAAIFLATISADPERAALFKLFWVGDA